VSDYKFYNRLSAFRSLGRRKYDGGAGARLALIIHICRVVTGEADTEAVDEHSVTAAIALVEYFKAHTRRVYQRLRDIRADQRSETLRRDLVDLGAGELRERQLPSGRRQRLFVLHADPSSTVASFI
jgi:Protein of unknown function (DUF3987)